MLTKGVLYEIILLTIKRGRKIMTDAKEIDEVMRGFALNGAMYLRSKTTEQIEDGEGLSAFDLSFAMEILTGMPKEECLNLLMEGQERIKKVYADIENASNKSSH